MGRNSGVVITGGENSHGVLAQSLGGGGGNSGMVINTIINTDASKATQISVSVGGSGGEGAVSKAVEVTNTGGIGTSLENSIGIFAQSLGGGGGNANTVVTGSISGKGAGNKISVGIGGAYLCVYGMEGPGGYQFVGRTLQMWNRYRQTAAFEQPWLLRCFDRLRFFPVSSDELQQIRRDFPRGDYALRIEPGRFSLSDYKAFLADNRDAITTFETRRQEAFDSELQRWRDSGQLRTDPPGT